MKPLPFDEESEGMMEGLRRMRAKAEDVAVPAESECRQDRWRPGFDHTFDDGETWTFPLAEPHPWVHIDADGASHFRVGFRVNGAPHEGIEETFRIVPRVPSPYWHASKLRVFRELLQVNYALTNEQAMAVLSRLTLLDTYSLADPLFFAPLFEWWRLVNSAYLGTLDEPDSD